jgi:hypothetical protein
MMSNPSLQCNDFDSKVDIMYSCMSCIVVKIIVPFFEFCNQGTQHACNYVGSMLQKLAMFAKIHWLGACFNGGVGL